MSLALVRPVSVDPEGSDAISSEAMGLGDCDAHRKGNPLADVPTAVDEDDDGVRRRLTQTLIAAILAAVDGDGPQVDISLTERYLAAIKAGYRKPLEEFMAERLHECEAPSAPRTRGGRR